MKILVEKGTNVLLDIGNIAEVVENGVLFTSDKHTVIYAVCPDTTYDSVYIIEDVDEIPDGVAPFTHLYVNGTFEVNPNYVPPTNSTNNEEQLRQRIQELEQLLADATDILIEAGVL